MTTNAALNMLNRRAIAINATPQPNTTITRALSKMHLTAESHANPELDARLENLPKELVDTVASHLEPQDICALSATSKQLDSKLFDRKFEHLRFYACMSEQKLKDIQNITSHNRFRLTVRSVTMRPFPRYSSVWHADLEDQKSEFLPLLQKAESLTHLTVRDDIKADAVLPAVVLPNLKRLSLIDLSIDLETVINFINVQPKLEEVHIDCASVQDVELGDIEQDLGLCDLGGPAIEEERLGFQASVLIRERTGVRNIKIDEESDRLREPWLKDRRRSQRVGVEWSRHFQAS